MSEYFRCAETKLLFRFQSYKTLSGIFLSELYNIRENVRNPSPICRKRPLSLRLESLELIIYVICPVFRTRQVNLAGLNFMLAHNAFFPFACIRIVVMMVKSSM